MRWPISSFPGTQEKNERIDGNTVFSFDEARSVFLDENAKLIADPDHSDEEDRFVLLGLSYRLRLLVVCHAYRDDREIRIISARKASRRERAQYAE